MKLPKIDIPKKAEVIKLAEDLDFYHLFEQIESEVETCFILESLGVYSDLSRYSIIGFNPDHIISARQNILTIDNKEYKVENPYFALREIVPQDVLSRDYAGGLVGYLGYDVINYFEPKLKVALHEKYPQFMFGVYTDGLIYDKLTNEIFYVYYRDNKISEIKKIMSKKVITKKPEIKFLGNTITKEEHAKIVERVKEHIRAGDIFQCEVGFKSEYTIRGNTLPIYTKLREVNPSPFMYYVKFDAQKIIGASPELFLKLRNQEMETFPLAGTIKRGKDSVEDKQLARKLLNDPKEIAEHNMLVDLHRNDMGKVAEFGSVKVRNLMSIKKFSHVQHIESQISGVLRNDLDMFDALAANFPMGTVTGTPKVESMKIIDRNENAGRGPYGGALGHFGFNGDCTFALPLRTLFISDEYAYTQTSGGIVYDSVPECEYDEIVNKLKAMKTVLESLATSN